jgi:hypothetical protein
VARDGLPYALVAGAVVVCLILPGAEATQGVSARASLPMPLAGAGVASDGRFVYALGGVTGAGRSDKALRYDPENDAWMELCACIPDSSPSRSLAAAWTGREFLVAGFGDRILRYEPTESKVAWLGARLPSPRDGASLVWDGHSAIVLGGRILQNGTPSEFTDEIVRIDPANDTAHVMTARLPSARAFASAAWDGYYAYLFDGEDESGPITRILRYDPQSDLVGFEETQDRRGLTGSSAVWLGGWAYVFGGRSVYGPANDALRWDIGGSNGISGWGFLGGQTGGGRWDLGAALVGRSAYLVGGRDANGPVRTHVRIDLDAVNPDPPTLWAPPSSSPAPARNAHTSPSSSTVPTMGALSSPTPAAGSSQVGSAGAPSPMGPWWPAMDAGAWATLVVGLAAGAWALFLYAGARRRRAWFAECQARIRQISMSPPDREGSPGERLLQESNRLHEDLKENRLDEQQHEMLQRLIDQYLRNPPQAPGEPEPLANS